MEEEIRNILYGKLKEFGHYENVKIKYPNLKFIKTDLELYIDVSIMPVDPEVLTLCSGGSRYTWLFQTSIYYLANDKGEGNAARYIDKLRTLLPAATKLSGTKHNFIVVKPASPAPPVKMAGWFFIPVQFRLQTIC